MNNSKVIFVIICLALIFLFIANNKKTDKRVDNQLSISSENKQLIAAICLEISDLVSAVSEKNSTLGESIEKYKKLVENFGNLRSKLIAEVSSAKNGKYKEFLNLLLDTTDNSLTISEKELKIAQYQLQNLELEQQIRSEKDRAATIKSLDTYGTYRQTADQIIANADASLDNYRTKEKMIKDLGSDLEGLFNTEGNKIALIRANLSQWGFDDKALFPAIERLKDRIENK